MPGEEKKWISPGIAIQANESADFYELLNHLADHPDVSKVVCGNEEYTGETDAE